MAVIWNIAQGDKGQSVSVFINGRPFVADQKHTNYTAIVEMLLSGDTPDERQLQDLFDISIAVGQRFERIGETRVSVSNGRVYFSGEELESELTEQVLRFYEAGATEELIALANFFDKLGNNPNPHSRKMLYKFVRAHNLTITPDGDFVAYKGLGANYLSQNSGTAIVDGVVVKGQIPWAPGSIVSMPRNNVTFDPENGCSRGLHVATFDFASGWRASDGYIVKVYVNPRDVVSVPVDGAGRKMRVCEARIPEDAEVSGPIEDLVDYSEVEDDEEYEYYCRNCGSDTHDTEDCDDEAFLDPEPEDDEEDDTPIEPRGWTSWTQA